jgi:hypothetical protein
MVKANVDTDVDADDVAIGRSVEIGDLGLSASMSM